jgi:hypothetical protein
LVPERHHQLAGSHLLQRPQQRLLRVHCQCLSVPCWQLSCWLLQTWTTHQTLLLHHLLLLLLSLPPWQLLQRQQPHPPLLLLLLLLLHRSLPASVKQTWSSCWQQLTSCHGPRALHHHHHLQQHRCLIWTPSWALLLQAPAPVCCWGQ